MFGSIFYNCWSALIAFSIYFFIMLPKDYAPSRILFGSFLTAIIVFFAVFVVRYLIAYVFNTPEESILQNDDNDEVAEQDQEEQFEQKEKASTVEFQDESTEEIAQVVRTMMSRDENERVNS
ncbi:MAG: hypothetical protein RR595_00235 [Lysinibacillus sp.]